MDYIIFISQLAKLARIQHYCLCYISLKLLFFLFFVLICAQYIPSNTNSDISVLALRLNSVMQMMK